jgi:hypothetical protein
MGELGGAIILPGGDIYLLGTAQTEQTVYKEYHEEKGYELRIWPIVYPIPSDDPKLDEVRKYGPCSSPPRSPQALAENPHLAGTSVEPTRFTEADILQRRRSGAGSSSPASSRCSWTPGWARERPSSCVTS